MKDAPCLFEVDNRVRYHDTAAMLGFTVEVLNDLKSAVGVSNLLIASFRFKMHEFIRSPISTDEAAHKSRVLKKTTSKKRTARRNPPSDVDYLRGCRLKTGFVFWRLESFSKWRPLCSVLVLRFVRFRKSFVSARNID